MSKILQIAIATTLLGASSLVYGQTMLCDIHFERHMNVIEHDGQFRACFSKTENEGTTSFTVTNCQYDVVQVVHDSAVQKTYELPANINLKGDEGELSKIMGKSITYTAESGKKVLKEDQTSANTLIGALSGLTMFIAVEEDQWPNEVLGFPIQPHDEVVISNAPPFELRSRRLDRFGVTEPARNYEISVVNTETGEKLYSRLVLTNLIMVLESTLQDQTFPGSRAAALLP